MKKRKVPFGKHGEEWRLYVAPGKYWFGTGWQVDFTPEFPPVVTKGTLIPTFQDPKIHVGRAKGFVDET